MPKTVAPLTQLHVRNAKPREKACKLAAGGGLYFEVTSKGGKLWCMKFRQLDGSENRLSFGVYPDVSLVDTRSKCDEARKLIAIRKDPARDRGDVARQARTVSGNSFEKVSSEWRIAMLGQWQPKTVRDILQRLEVDVFGAFGDAPVTEVQPQEVLLAIRDIEVRGGAHAIARRTAVNCSRIFRYAIRSGIAERNVAATMRDVLGRGMRGASQLLKPDDLPAFLQASCANEAYMGLRTQLRRAWRCHGKMSLPDQTHQCPVLANAGPVDVGRRVSADSNRINGKTNVNQLVSFKYKWDWDMYLAGCVSPMSAKTGRLRW